MRGLKKQRRIQIIAMAVVGLIIASVTIGYALRDGINFFYSPTQVVENPPSEKEEFRIGGLVVDDSIVNGEGFAFQFVVTDGNAEIPVAYIGNEPRPDLFKEGEGTVATGYYVNNVFQAHTIFAKHDETYMPVEVIDALKEQGVYKEPDA
ncbi:MAG: cytochrome c maturation protein CcmE [Litoreibacter sp.]|nr:cytochrome c maturation protein CcmE [Litoreibacter sp.]